MPTIFWLTCPYLVAEVAKLESAGAVKYYEKLVATDENLAQAYISAHEAYKKKRLSLLSPAELDLARKQGLRAILEAGIAGTTNPKRVKCLHAQLAHFLATGENPLGALLASELKILQCHDNRCAQALAEAERSPP